MPQLSSTHRLILTIQFCSLSNPNHQAILSRKLLKKWISASLEKNAELTIRFVDTEEAQNLNSLYRKKNYIPNVLTFAYNDEIQNDLNLYSRNRTVFADILLCCKKIEEEAIQQSKPLLAHYAHLVVHGVLHAQGYDHQNTEDAIKMESLEVKILKNLGFSSPY